MSAHRVTSRRVGHELEQLNSRQREAVLHVGNLAVLAGPGSGKTKLLVAKIAYTGDVLLDRGRSIAAMTYTRHAAREIISRYRSLASDRSENQVLAGTVHSWCLRGVLLPYSHLVGISPPGKGSILDDRDERWAILMREALGAAGIVTQYSTAKTNVIRARRLVAAGQASDHRDPLVAAAAEFDRKLTQCGLIDFDGIVATSLKLLSENEKILTLLRSKYPYILIDEYQDLGPVLHQLATLIADSTQVTVTAVGDPDQTIMGFAGADPRYLTQLVTLHGFKKIPLELNYRFGDAIIAASHAALGESRNHSSNPAREDKGVIDPIRVRGGLDDHGRALGDRVQMLIESGLSPHDIAVLYPSKGPLLDAITSGLEVAGVDYHHEADHRLPGGQLSEFVQDCAARTIASFRRTRTEPGTDLLQVKSLANVCRDYESLRSQAELGDLMASRREAHRRIHGLVSRYDQDWSNTPLLPWLEDLVSSLELDVISENLPSSRDKRSIEELRRLANSDDRTVGSLASGIIRTGRVTLATYHAAKGREWASVVLPGLAEGIMPRLLWDGRSRKYVEPPATEIAAARRLFYVGLTRARNSVTLIYGDRWEPWPGECNTLGESRFVLDLLANTGDQKTP
jgi:DNA helicase-2/ATP-dependent DNA helicase PcrA